MRLELLDGRGREPGEVVPFEFLRHVDGEVLRQQHDVLATRPQRRQRDDVEGEPVEQVAAELAVGREAREILVGRRDQPHVGAQRAAAAEAFELAVLDHAQDLLLHEYGRRRELVEEQGAAVGALEAALVGARRARERPGLVAEQLALEQGIRDRGAVHRQISGVPPIRQVVQPRRHEFLAGAPFADDEYGFLERGDGETSSRAARNAGDSPTSRSFSRIMAP